MASGRERTRDLPVKYVQIDGLVALKIIKHCQEEGAGGTDLVQGVLLGLVVDTRLEITNCFPFPRHTEDEDFDEVQYQMEMMRNLRHVNIDHLHVGWYQSTYFGSFLNKALLDSQFNYQHSIEESVVLIYDPLRTSQGYLTLKAYRLTPAMMDMYKEGDFSPEAIKEMGISFENMFEEIPVVMKNSHLVNALLCEIQEIAPEAEHYQSLDLATASVLEKNVRQLMENVDELVQDTNKYINYQRQSAKQQQAKQQYLQKRRMENEARAAKGQPPLPEEDINKVFKPLNPPPRLDNLLTCGQVNTYCQQMEQFVSQSFGKLFMAESLQKDSKP
ncbi:eukaryotic translation initiation factor 3 subunit H [Lingula anatina]|uniref:Eukaryotic translation initiation factor 3 subunit H n=1 Tax=Lingula anatina TaxID=7574 RepID=A0A1S3J421_LINAN|nr:eukaryotic translation initiation factor 3 subunit H [Lingula anatina]|eukprot:XP_013405028.1 eukaryotic translation initiation factor 3 subunit H [Lingula anatina]